VLVLSTGVVLPDESLELLPLLFVSVEFALALLLLLLELLVELLELELLAEELLPEDDVPLPELGGGAGVVAQSSS
jgi:hypothetical protein